MKQAPTLVLARRVAAAVVVLGTAGLALVVWLLPPAQAPRVAPSGFTGRISDRDGNPVAGARIEATWIGQDEAPRSLAATRADARGHYLLTVQPPPAEQGILALQVGASGFGTVGRRVTPAERKQDFRLARGATRLTLRVATEDGAAVAAADVIASIEPVAGSPDALVVLAGKTGADGVWTFAVRSEAHGFERGSDVRLTAGATTTFEAEFPQGLELTGTVVDAARRPVVGALVDAYSATAGGEPGAAPVGRAVDDFSGNFTHTDEAGRFRFAGLAAGSYRLRVSSPHSVPLAMDVRAPGPASPLELQLPAPATLRVSVAGPQSTGSILIESHDGAGFSAAKAVGPDATAEFSLLPAGDYRVRAALDRVLEIHAQVRAGSEQTVHFDSRAPSAQPPATAEKPS